MNINPKEEKRMNIFNTFKGRLLLYVILFAIAVLMVLITAGCDQSLQVNSSIAERNLQSIRTCLDDTWGCQGGFVKQTDGRILRIMHNCLTPYCVYELETRILEIKMSAKNPWLPSHTTEWVMPGDDGWEKAAVEYERQFLIRPKAK